MTEDYVRPDPEELLRLVSGEARDERRGHLTIFFGYAPGVGKTYAMLYDASMRKNEGLEVVIGYVQLHKRPETQALQEGLEIIPPKKTTYGGIELLEPDIELIIKRKPHLVLVDELAHTNAPGMKNLKRYQDIAEVLEAGIDVYTTLNVQHIETLKDIVYQITETKVRENIPDPVFLQADEVKLIDLPIDDLLKRLRDGKIYTEDMAEKAVNKFFRSGNLLALRQIALRQVALRIDQQISRQIRTQSSVGAWQTTDKVVVGVSESPYAEQLMRAAYRLAVELDAELIALHMETEGHEYSDDEKKWLGSAFDVAEKLGVKKVTVHGRDFAKEISKYAQQNRITKIVIGKPNEKSRLHSVDTILSLTHGIDVYIFAGRGEIMESWDQRTRDPFSEMIGKIRVINNMIRIR